jgi:hypothetical protein
MSASDFTIETDLDLDGFYSLATVLHFEALMDGGEPVDMTFERLKIGAFVVDREALILMTSLPEVQAWEARALAEFIPIHREQELAYADQFRDEAAA